MFRFVPKRSLVRLDYARCKRFQSTSLSASEVASRVERLLYDFRANGHMHSHVNIFAPPTPFPVNLRGLSADDVVDRSVGEFAQWCKREGSSDTFTVGKLVEFLQETYCSTLSIEFDYLPKEERNWLARAMESTPRFAFTETEQEIRYAQLLTASQDFDHYVHRKLRSVKRYGLEGAESLVVAMDSLFQTCVAEGIDDVVIGMPHRGRNNLLAVLLKYPVSSIFAKMSGHSLLPEGVIGTDDVLSHIAQSVDLGTNKRSKPKFCVQPLSDEEYKGRLHVSLLHNPSHLEAVNPVGLGKTRARQDERRLKGKRGTRRRGATLTVLMHGDSAAAGQGVVPESTLLSRLPGYTTGGSVHVIVNNQLGFTTPDTEARSSRYASDVAKINGAPVLRVSGEDPAAVARAASLAVRYRKQFGGDVWIDLVVYRRHGHNELDEPSFTQPRMYANIASQYPIGDTYSSQLAERNVWSTEARDAKRAEFRAQLDEQFAQVGTPAFKPAVSFLASAKWSGLRQGTAAAINTPVDTGVAEDTLRLVANASVQLPDGADPHRRLKKSFLEARLKRMEGKAEKIDWATAEALAFGSLIVQGYGVRLSGQDCQRGTFSHRHVVITDQRNDERLCPLNANLEGVAPDNVRLEAINSPLSEFGVMGFEYGYSLQRPDVLTLWEAQFGDFANTAQVIIDQFVASGEHKWLRQSGLVLLLPHGYDGAGPEHSSCRIERFLQLSNEPFDREAASAADMLPNWTVVNCTTPANYFHVLRRQMVWPFRKPLVVVAPKALIRLPACVSPLADMLEGTSFAPVLQDDVVSSGASEVLLCSGKLYYELLAERAGRQGQRPRTAVIRIEQLAPFPYAELASALAAHPDATTVRWAQEEPQNQGAWCYVAPRFDGEFGAARGRIRYVGPPPMAAPATGVHAEHTRLQQGLYTDCLGPKAANEVPQL